MKSELKIGLILENDMLPAWVVSVIEDIVRLSYVHLSLVIKSSPTIPPKEPFLYMLFGKGKTGPLKAPDAFELKNISELMDGIPTMEDGSDETLKQTASAGLDILINFSRYQLSDIYRGYARYGVWRHFFSETRDTDVPGVWEVLERRPVTISGVEITESEGGGRIVYQSVSLTYPYSIRESLNSHYWKSASFIPRVLDILHKDVNEFDRIALVPYTSVTPKKKYLGAPTNLSILDAFVNLLPRRINTVIRNLSVKRDWMLMYDADSYTGKPFNIMDFKPLMPPAGYFWADPLIVEKDGKHYVFLEEYVYAKGRGHISVMEIDDNGRLSAAVPILECPYHLSYPFVFEKDGKYYMIPESSDNHTIDLYECTEFPYKWAFKKNLLSGIRAVDSTVLFHDSNWWLFTNIKEHEGGSFLDELFLFHTPDIINTELKSHPRNPVVSDVRSARPAGPVFMLDAKLYRPSQVCAPYYGWGVSVNKITKLTEHEYEERQVSLISPERHDKISGIHTLTYAGKFCVVDALMDMKK